MDRKENNEILQKVRRNISLEVITKILKMRYFGHVMRAHQSLEKYIMLGITAGERGPPYAVYRRHQKCNWTLSKNLYQLVRDLLVNNIFKKKKRTNV